MLRNWRDERDSAALCRALAMIERNPRLSRVFSRLAESERRHSSYWHAERRSHSDRGRGPGRRRLLAAEQAIAQDPRARQTLIGEERLINVAGRAHNAASAAAYSFSLFALGACVPLLAFFFAASVNAIVASIMLSMLALFSVGLVTSLFNARPPTFSGLRQVGIGAAAAALTYAAGRLVRTALG